MPTKRKIISERYLDFTLQPLIYHETDTTSWARLLIKTGDNILITHFWWKFFAHPLPEILTKNNIKETFSKGNIWGQFYTTRGEG